MAAIIIENAGFWDYIIEIQKVSDINFLDYVKKLYKQFYNRVYEKTKNITSEIFPKISNVISIILDTGYYAVTYSDENKNPSDIIYEYLKNILKKHSLCLCIDNFSRCNIETADFFIQILKRLIHETNYRACIITTTEDLKPELKDIIFYNLPYKDITISELDKFNYFYQILNPIFQLNNFDEYDIEYLYKKCEGSPKKLSTIISKLLEKNAIILPKNNKARIDKKVLFTLLQSNRVKFDENDFSSESKWVLFSYLCLKEKVSVDLVKDLSLYISKRCFLYQAYNEKLFIEELLKLVDNKILSFNNDNTISPVHDLDYIELNDIFKEFSLYRLFSQYTYEYFILNRHMDFSEELICKHSCIANIGNWEIRNFRYGKRLFHSGQAYDAQKVFDNLKDSMHKMHPFQILFVALASYETGNYQLAIEYFSLIMPDQLKYKKAKYYYYFYMGKSYNNLGKTIVAAEMLEKALNESEKNSLLYVQTLNVLHMYYFEIPNKIEESRKFFLHIQSHYEETYPVVWANTMKECPNFLDNKSSAVLLRRAESKLYDELDKAFLKTSLGFILVKLDQIMEAESEFIQAQAIIKRLKIHEISYVTNNIAVCKMMDNHFEEARELLLDAILWNRTSYGKIVLQTHLMICAYYCCLYEECNYYFEILENYMDNNVIDPVMNRKVYMNLAIICQKEGNSIMEERFFDKARPYIKNSSSEWRYNVLTNTVNANKNRPTEKYLQIINFDPWFLIYAHD